jgi:hypothetical protein
MNGHSRNPWQVVISRGIGTSGTFRSFGMMPEGIKKQRACTDHVASEGHFPGFSPVWFDFCDFHAI